MVKQERGGLLPRGLTRHLGARRIRPAGRRGVILLAVLVFIALLLPLVTLVLTSVNTETVATSEAIKGAKAEMASEKALNDAISLVVQEKSLPAYWTSVTQPDTAIIVLDQTTGARRDQIPDQGNAGGAGPDDILGTADDYWIGPRYDRSYNGATDQEDSPRMYRYDFAFESLDAPTYLGQSWSFAASNEPYGRSPNTGNRIWFLNQFGVVDGVNNDYGNTDVNSDGVDEGFDANDTSGLELEAELKDNGYYLGADEPRVGGPGTAVNRDLTDANIRQYMYNAKVNLYESVFTDLDLGPMPTNLLKSYADVTDEAGRLNLNIFCKKVRVWMPEAAETDYDFDGYGTNDYNGNETPDEPGWKWIDNPLFPDKDSTRKYEFNATTETFTDAGEIDWGGLTQQGLFANSPDGFSMPDIGESVQHYYQGDSDGDGIPESVESMRNSIQMLLALPGMTGELACRVLTYLNPPQEAAGTDGFDLFADGTPYKVLRADYNSGSSIAPSTAPDPQAGDYRLDACNLTPALVSLAISVTGGVVDDFRWDFGLTDEDDMPLPSPRPLSNLDQLVEAGLTDAQVNRIRDSVTIFSYDTNVIGTNIQDVAQNADLVNAFQPGDPEFSGATLRQTPASMQDTDNVPDLRYDVDRFVFGATLSDYRSNAEEMYAHLRNHLPRPLLDKITLPVVDRMGRAGALDSLVANSDARYDPSLTSGAAANLLPHRDDDVRVYNAGESGREDDPDGGGPAVATEYPALNTPFSIDSCMSLVLYRNGTLLEEDDYSYDPQNGAWLPFANRGLLNLFPFGIPAFVDFLGPFGNQIRAFFEPNNNPSPFRGNNINPDVRAHGFGVFEVNNLLQGGNFNSVADVMNVPLYKFGRMSVSLMADPPSDFRFDADDDNNVDAGLPEQGEVNYFVAFSDVVDAGWYLEHVHPDGPDQRPNTADDPDLNDVLYEMHFTGGNRPGLAPGANPLVNDYTIVLRGYQLRAVGGGVESGNTKVTIAAYDNVNNLDLLSVQYDSGLAIDFDWQNVPFSEEDGSAGAVGADADGRPLANADWPNGIPPHAEAWAYDGAGDPYITARVEVVKWDPVAGAPAVPEERCDDVSKVYLQYNQDADAPLRVDILPVRISGDLYEMRSSIGGETTTNGSYVLYDWDYEDPLDGDTEPDDYDGTWPVGQPGQAPSTQIIQIRPEINNVTLRVYDLRSFDDDPINPSTLPIGAGYPNLPPSIWAGDRVAPLPGFPSGYGGSYPPPGTTGYAEDGVIVQQIEDITTVRAEIAAVEPSVYEDDAEVRFNCGAAGGNAPYDYRVQILDPNRGSGGGGAAPYLTPDGGGGTINTWPQPIGANGARPSRVTAPGVPYDTSFGGSVLLTQSALAQNEVRRTFTFDTSALAPGQYWVELRVQDSDGGTPDDFVYTKLAIGTDSSPANNGGIPPALNASITLSTFDSSGSEGAKGFTADVALDPFSGGVNNYRYYWEVRRPVYSGGNNPTVIAEELVPMSLAASNPAPGIPSQFSSQEKNPSFQFLSDPSSDGVYLVHCWVLDGANGLPSNGTQRTLAHDVAMITLTDSGTNVGGQFSSDALARTPMAVLTARPPGNSGPGYIGNNSIGSGGAGRPYIGVSPTLSASALEPDVAGQGDVIIVRGFNFDPVVSNNIVRFGGDVTSRAFGLVNLADTITIGGNVYNQQELSVVVPTGARSGYLNVTTPSGTSERIFFQTGFNVDFDLIGKLSTNDPSYLQFELDYQGDGVVDYTFNTQSNPDHPGILRSGEEGVSIVHDYASDGIGNFDATLIVTDLISGRKQVSHQLVTIRDLRPSSTSQLTIAAGSLDSASAVSPFTLVDADGKFNTAGVAAGDVVINLANQTLVALVLSRDSDTQLTLNSGIFAPGDVLYEIRRSVDEENVNGMIANIWPEVDLRSETFAPNAAPEGTAFGSAVAGVASAGIKYKWQIDGSGNRSAPTAGELVEQGCITQEDLLGLELIDNTKNFFQSGKFGVREGDLVINTTDGSRANVREVLSADTILLQSATNNNIGLTGGGNVVRSGVADNPVPNATLLIDNVPMNYDFTGDNCINQGGLVAGDVIQNLTTGASATVVSSPADGQLITTALTGGFSNNKGSGTAQAAPPPGSGGNTLVDPGGFGLVNVGDLVTNITQGTNGVVTGWVNASQITTDITWNVGDAYTIFNALPNTWSNGDVWQVIIPANQWRIGYEYTISTSDGFSTGSSADAAYASDNALVDFRIEMLYPWDLDSNPNNPSLIEVDWDGDNAVDNTYPVGISTRIGGGVNQSDNEVLRVSHAFPVSECAPRVGKPGFVTRAQYRVFATPMGQTAQNSYPGPATWYSLPTVVIAADEFDTDLRTLNLDSWEIDAWHRVTMESQYLKLSSENLQGVNAPLNRYFYASDEAVIPVGLGNNFNTLSTWVSYSSPFVYSNAIAVTSMKHTAVHGQGGALNYMSDANADGRWESASIYESPQGDNPVNFHEFTFFNGDNNMPVPGGGLGIKGASFPATFPGATTGGNASGNYYSAGFGLYNGYGFVSDNLAQSERAFSFDSQALMKGAGFGNANLVSLAPGVDFFVDPIVGSNSSMVQLTSRFTGTNATAPRYRWEVQKISGPGYTGPVGIGEIYSGAGGFTTGGSSNAPNPVFSPAGDIADEAGAPGSGQGQYRIWLMVDLNSDNIVDVTSPSRVIDIVTPPLMTYVMADPPSASVGSAVNFHVFVDGGTGPYRVELDADDDGVFEQTKDIYQGNEVTFSHVYNEPSNDLTDLTGDYLATIRVTDSAGGVNFGGATDTDTSVVKIAETIPLNASLVVNPPSGVAPFIAEVHYAVSGGSPFSNDEYNISLQLVNTNGEGQPAVTRRLATSMGANHMLEDPRDPNISAANLDDPVLFLVPEAGNYYVQMIVTDDDGHIVTKTEDVFATGYLAPQNYGDSTPRVVKDANGRPMQAVRIWTDPFLNIGGGNTNGYQNPNPGDEYGGRLREADLQVIGDALTTDPSSNFRSLGLYATKDPQEQPLYYADYAVAAGGQNLVQDFYDTFSPGRVNLNTASEEVLTAVFSRIIKVRAYFEHTESADVNGDGDTNDPGENFYWVGNSGTDLDNDGNVDLANDADGDGDFTADERMRNVRDYANDLHITDLNAPNDGLAPGAPRALAQAVIRYRTMFYDSQKPDAPSNGTEFGYVKSGSGDPDLGDFRVDHLPVIGPWDGVNPHMYAPDDRNASLLDANAATLPNSWDNIAGTYYNFDPAAQMFYAPTDTAVVRGRYEVRLGIDVNGDGDTNDAVDFNLNTFENASNYAKYLNDTSSNDFWTTDRYANGTIAAAWNAMGLYPDANNYYSRWAFDARNYFSYEGGAFAVTVDATTPSNFSVTQLQPPGTPADARNKMGIINSNGETAYTFIPNAPFNNIFDLYKVIENAGAIRSYDLSGTQMALTADRMSVNSRRISGPSVFRCSMLWDDDRSEFVPLANYLDDIAPFVTTRSYVFRVDSAGAVQPAEGEGGQITRERGKQAVIDVGKLWARRSGSALDLLAQLFGLTPQNQEQSYRVMWFKSSGE